MVIKLIVKPGIACSIILWFLVASNCLALRSDPLKTRLPNVPVPDAASWYWVGERMAYNGLPMSIKMFRYPGTEKSLQAFYRNYWRLQGHGQLVEKDFGAHKLMSYDLRGIYTSVQYRTSLAGVEGKLVVTESPGRRRPDRKSRLPVPPTAVIASKVETLDGSTRSETLTIESFKTLDFNKRYYENQLLFDQWKLVFTSGDGRQSSIQHYQKGADQLQITIKKLSGIDKNHSQILLHWIKS